jgi:hypothetical protein
LIVIPAVYGLIKGWRMPAGGGATTEGELGKTMPDAEAVG